MVWGYVRRVKGGKYLKFLLFQQTVTNTFNDLST